MYKAVRNPDGFSIFTRSYGSYWREIRHEGLMMVKEPIAPFYLRMPNWQMPRALL